MTSGESPGTNDVTVARVPVGSDAAWSATKKPTTSTHASSA